ncbi:adenylosuccinate synthetase [Lizonia empirigonia]|nr:adenylosuccinate synthetase [Lizonia empirigonia]
MRRLASGYKKRFGNLFAYDVEDEIARYKEYRDRVKPYVVDQVAFLKPIKEADAHILVEGANALMLNIDAGTYPFVTSSNTGLGGVLTSLPLGWRSISDVIGVVKAYTTRVGSGPFPTEQLNEHGEQLQTVGREFGATTSRKRRCGWLDLVVARYSTRSTNDFDTVKIATAYVYKGTELQSFPANLDVLAQVEVKYQVLPGWKRSTVGTRSFEELPENARKYVLFIEEFLGLKVAYIGTGPGRESMIIR